MLSPRKLQAFLLHGSSWSNRSSVAPCRTFSQRGESMMTSSAFSIEGITFFFYIGFLAYSSYKHDCYLKVKTILEMSLKPKWYWTDDLFRGKRNKRFQVSFIPNYSFGCVLIPADKKLLPEVSGASDICSVVLYQNLHHFVRGQINKILFLPCAQAKLSLIICIGINFNSSHFSAEGPS